MSELPEGWARVTLEEILEPGGLFDGPFGSNLKTSDYTTTGVRVIRLENVANIEFIADKETYISEQKFSTLVKHEVRQGDIIVGSFVDGAVRVCVLPGLPTRAIAKADCFCVRPIRAIADASFITFQLGMSQTRDALVEDIHGATRPRITTKQLRKHVVVLAPIAEQLRIVERMEALLAEVNRAKARLDRVAQILKRFRQAVLTAASSGDLTAQWRAADETSKGGGNKDPLSVSVATADADVTLPAGWKLVPFQNIVTNFDGKRVPIKSTDREKRRGPYPYYGASGIIDSIDHFIFDGEYLLIAEDGANLLSRSTPIAFRASGKFWVNNHAHIVQPRNEVLAEYLEICLNAMDLQHYVTGSAQPKLTQAALNSLPMPIPTKSEQAEVVRQVKVLFLLADAVERRLKAGTACAEKLPQAILAKAFSGDLVPTEAELARAEGRTYETAEQLLRRIGAAKEGATAAEPAKPSRRPRTPRRNAHPKT